MWTVIALFFIISVSGCGSPYKGGPALTAYFTSLSSNPYPGSLTLQKNSANKDTVYIDVKVTKVNNVFGASIKIDYDASKVKWAGSYREGDFLEKSGASPTYRIALDGNEGEGRLVVGVSLVSPVVPVSGSGTVITIPFKVIARGDSAISLYDSILADSFAKRIIIITRDKGGMIAGF